MISKLKVVLGLIFIYFFSFGFFCQAHKEQDVGEGVAVSTIPVAPPLPQKSVPSDIEESNSQEQSFDDEVDWAERFKGLLVVQDSLDDQTDYFFPSFYFAQCHY